MYSGLREVSTRYWTAYGGTKALIRSPYLHIAALVLLTSYHYWSTTSWWEQPLSIIPNLLGFSLGGLAMLLSFGNAEFQKFISEKDENSPSDPTAFIEVSASFVHFMLLQLASLLLATIFNALDFYAPWPPRIRPILDIGNVVLSGFGYLLFLYSITAMIAAVFAVFRMTSWFETFQNSPRK